MLPACHSKVQEHSRKLLTCNYVVVLGVQELVDLWQAPLHVPERDQPKGGCRSCLALVLVFKYPVHPVCAVTLCI